MRILLAGSPNCGTTTLFNALTGERARVGNRIGVTVEVRRARMKRPEAELWDLPGLYTLAGGGADERAAFIFHARHLSEEWSCDWSLVPDTHHFNVLDGLCRADDPLTRLVLGE